MTATQATPPLTAKQAIDWSKVVEAHRDWIKRLVVARTGGEDSADDVIQEVGLAVTRSNARPTCSEEVAPWLCKIAIRQCAMIIRSQARRQNVLDGFCRASETQEPERADPIFWLLHREQREIVRSELAAMDPQSRQLLVWKYVNWNELRGHRLAIGRFQAYGGISSNESQKTDSPSPASPRTRWRHVAMNTPDENLILRFASGELSAEEEQALLAGCETAPDCWREAVLAVAEHRRMVEALGEMAGTERDSPIFAETKIGTVPSVMTGHTKQGAGRWCSLAAVAAAALAAGLLLGIVSTRKTSLVGGHQAQVAQTPAVEHLPPPVNLASDGAASDPGDFARMSPMLSDAQKAILKAHGFQVEEKPTLYIIPAANGTQWAIPTQQAELHYVKH